MIELRKNKQAGALTLLAMLIIAAIAALIAALLVWAFIEFWASPANPTTATPGPAPTTTTTPPPPQPPTGQAAGVLFPGGPIRGNWSGSPNVKNGEEQTFVFTITGVTAASLTPLHGAAVTFIISPPTHVEIVSLNGWAASGATPVGVSIAGEIRVVVKGTDDPPPNSGLIVATFTTNPADAAPKPFEIQAED